MATVVGGFGTSHTPMLSNDPAAWLGYGQSRDKDSPRLLDAAGARVTYEQLADRRGDSLAEDLAAGALAAKYSATQAAISRLATDIAAVDADAVIILGDDQNEVVTASLRPMFGIYWGEQWQMRSSGTSNHAFVANSHRASATDGSIFRGSPELGADLVSGLVERDFDITSLESQPEGMWFGHAFGYVMRSVLRDRPIAAIPVLVNTYFPPNQPSAARCYDFGVALAEAVHDSPSDKKVMVAASGGLSHFVVNAELDRIVLDAIVAGDEATLRSIPRKQLLSGTSETLNWIAVAGAMSDKKVVWHEYQPLYRSPAGTGCGVAFLRWG